MKRKILFLIILFPLALSAQYNSAAVKFGLYNPSAIDGGFIIGYEGRSTVDRNLHIGWSADWFHKNYVDQTMINEINDFYGLESRTNELRATTNIHQIPLMFSATGEFPLMPRIKAYVSGGAGIEALLIFYNNFRNTDEDEFHAAFDFAWRIGGGIMYELGRRSDIFVEFTYHSSKPSWTYEVEDPTAGYQRTFERSFDMSGLMSRFGFRFYY